MKLIEDKTFNKIIIDKIIILIFLGLPLIFITGSKWLISVVFPIGVLLYWIYMFRGYKYFKV